MKPKQFYSTKSWQCLSRYVLLYYSDGLITQCCTCGQPLQINTSNCHCGHLIKYTDSKATALEFINMGPQCMPCNRYAGGKQDIMYQWAVKQHGQKAIDNLYIQKHNTLKLGAWELEVFYKLYKPLFDKEVENKGNPWKK